MLARDYVKGQPEKALMFFQRSLALDPSLASIHYILARIYRKMGNNELARQHFQLFQKWDTDPRRQRVDGARQRRAQQVPPDVP